MWTRLYIPCFVCTSRDVVISVVISFDITESYSGRCGLDCIFHALCVHLEMLLYQLSFHLISLSPTLADVD